MKAPALSWREVLGLTFLLSSLSLVYEMAITACFVMMTGDEVFWQSLTVGLYLASLGAGAFWAARRKDGTPIELLFRIELALAMAGALAVFWILSCETVYRFYYRFFRDTADPASLVPYVLTLAACHLSTLVIGVLSGYELPLMLELARRESKAGEETRWILGLNYFGALGGSLLFSLALLPHLDIFYTVIAAAVLNWGVCVYLLWRGVIPATRVRLAAIAAAAFVMAAAGINAGSFYRFYVLNAYAANLGVTARIREDGGIRGSRATFGEMLSRLSERQESFRRLRTRYQVIDLLEVPGVPSELMAHYNARLRGKKGFPQSLMMFLDRRYQFHGAVEAAYHEHMAHVPIQIFGKVPEDILILGGGDGLLARELLKYDALVKTITLVELDAAVIALAREEPRIKTLNGGSLEHAKVRVLTDDAYYFVRNCRDKYDAVYIDFPYPYNYSVSKLYSVEFYRAVAGILKEGGVATMDYPLEDLRPEKELSRKDRIANSMAFSTVKAAGFKTVFPYNTDSPELVSFARAQELRHELGHETPQETLRRHAAVKRLRALGAPADIPGRVEDLAVIANRSSGESFLAFTKERREPRFAFKDYGIELHNLNARRLRVLDGVEFPRQEDRRWVNSIFRPVFQPLHLADFAYDSFW